MAESYENIKSSIEAAKAETSRGSNTATRIGNILLRMLEYASDVVSRIPLVGATAGLMSISDKTKLDAIEVLANKGAKKINLKYNSEEHIFEPDSSSTINLNVDTEPGWSDNLITSRAVQEALTPIIDNISEIQSVIERALIDIDSPEYEPSSVKIMFITGTSETTISLEGAGSTKAGLMTAADKQKLNALARLHNL